MLVQQAEQRGGRGDGLRESRAVGGPDEAVLGELAESGRDPAHGQAEGAGERAPGPVRGQVQQGLVHLESVGPESEGLPLRTHLGLVHGADSRLDHAGHTSVHVHK
ncbi:hypothetical protein [Streptomyces sp. NBC_00118]|uniref:hypothetical protein n=1 Tax=unclassified Streptomyces TaxID=2593676 RepID=UPI00386792CC